jgi:hypothetical protein
MPYHHGMAAPYSNFQITFYRNQCTYKLNISYSLVDLIRFFVINATFSNISAISWRPVLVVEEAGEPPTMGKQLVSFITCGCESSASFFVIYKAGREPTPYW